MVATMQERAWVLWEAVRTTVGGNGRGGGGRGREQGRGRRNFEAVEQRLLLSGNVVINEIHYDPDIKTEQVEFVELTNAGDAPFDLSGAQFTNGISYTFPANTTLQPGQYLVVAANPSAVLTKFGVSALGPFSGKLSNEGEKVTLKSAAGVTLDEVEYGLGFPWPTSGDYGSSIELINPTFDNSQPGVWRSSAASVGTTLIASHANWRYRKGTSEPPSNWKLMGFNESSDTVAWQTGPTSIGYGDQDDNTTLTDMSGRYTSVYLRNTFTISGNLPTHLALRLYVDDGAIVYINGQEVARAHVSSGTKTYASTATDHEASWETFDIANAASILTLGTNTIAIHAMNSSSTSSDFSIDAELKVSSGPTGSPTPGRQNSVFATTTPPLMSDLSQSVQQPAAGEAVTISMKVTDPDGVQSVRLEYQVVDAGNYIRLTDSTYQTVWNVLVMHDDGLNGDAIAGDGVYSAVMPSQLQVNRRLVRYRVTAADTTGASIQAPYADDPQPNFAYFVYNGVPAWTGADQRGVTPLVTFGTDITNSIATYFLIANSTDVTNSQYNSSYEDTQFYGTMVYDGVVYDHIEFKIRGEFSTYESGKNKWRINFNTGHDFAARDNYGNLYKEKWARLNLNANASPWMTVNRGMAGLDEAVSNRLYQLAGVEAPNTNYVQFRVVDGAQEAPSDQYGGDLWGLYLAVEHTGGRFIDEHDLEDGNIYEIEDGVADMRNQGPTQPTDNSDWTSFKAVAQSTSAPLSFWENNVNLDAFYSFQAINRVVSNVDLRYGDNYVMYHSPDGLWQPIPWDLDMMYAPETHRDGQTYLSNMLVYPELEVQYANRARELLDLLFSNGSRTGGQVGQVVDEFARMLDPSDGAGGYLTGWAELDQFLWDYNPRTTSDHLGTFYKTPMNDTRWGGTWTRTLSSPDFEGMVKYVIDFMTDTDPNSWSIGDGDQRGYGFNYLEYEAADGLIPNRPTVSYTGAAGFPSDRLRFTTTAYTDPDNSAFAAMEWRIGEISNPNTAGWDPDQPWKYEIDSVWESGEVTSFNSSVSVPSGVLQPGHTYRLRVRMKDATGRWSHWSDVAVGATEFVAGEPVGDLQNSLRITELNYHPTPFGTIDKDEFEFIEFKNFGSQTIHLTGMQFTKGITMTLGDVSLAPGEIGVVVRNTAAFQSRYGTTIKILGDYGAVDGGKLDNSGEQVTLVDADGQIFKDFTYDDTGSGWYPTTDGNGYSLVVAKPATNPDLSSASSWRASLQPGGSPGVDETLARVTGVTVSSTAWTTAFFNSLKGASLGDGGVAMSAGEAQSPILPWTNLDRISVRFDQNVTLTSGDLSLTGITVAAYLIAGFTYDPVTFTATWTLAAPLRADRVTLDLADSVYAPGNIPLDGDWNGSFPSGNGLAGGHFLFTLNVLPGDVDRSGTVVDEDLAKVRNAQFATPGKTAYSVYVDVNGSASILANDMILVRNLMATSLPLAASEADPSADVATTPAPSADDATPVVTPSTTSDETTPAVPPVIAPPSATLAASTSQITPTISASDPAPAVVSPAPEPVSVASDAAVAPVDTPATTAPTTSDLPLSVPATPTAAIPTVETTVPAATPPTLAANDLPAAIRRVDLTALQPIVALTPLSPSVAQTYRIQLVRSFLVKPALIQKASRA